MKKPHYKASVDGLKELDGSYRALVKLFDAKVEQPEEAVAMVLGRAAWLSKVDALIKGAEFAHDALGRLCESGVSLNAVKQRARADGWTTYKRELDIESNGKAWAEAVRYLAGVSDGR